MIIMNLETISRHASRRAALESNKNLLSMFAVLKVVRQVASEYDLDRIPKNEHIIRYLQDSHYYRHLLMVKPAKTASGVAVIAVMPKPYACPHGRCIYPGGLEFNTPLSYTGTEPATKVAQRFSYDAYEQARSKMEQLQSRGHDRQD